MFCCVNTRLKAWIYEQTGLTFNEHIPFLDSKIVQVMICKSSYEFNTFVGLRVAEIQRKTDIDGWLHISSEYNIADIITRGASPNKLGPSSIWQTGPLWLVKNRSEWPATRVNQGVSEDEIKEFCSKKKVQTLVASANQSIKDHLDELINFYSSLDKLIKTTAYILRWKFFKTIQDKETS